MEPAAEALEHRVSICIKFEAPRLTHNKMRGYLNVFRNENGGWQCKPDASCSVLP